MCRNLSSVKMLPKARQRPRLFWSISRPFPCLSILRITCNVEERAVNLHLCPDLYFTLGELIQFCRAIGQTLLRMLRLLSETAK